jgi:putative transposase
MSRKVPFVEGEAYHVFNRGVEKRIVFNTKQDYLKFLFYIEIMNSSEDPLKNLKRLKYVQGPTLHTGAELVEIINYSLMPNHFHLFIRENVSGGTSKFLQKILTAYTMYFNKKYDRTGALFQGKTKSRHVDTDKYFNYLNYYIDLNPLDLLHSGWKTKGVPSSKKAIEFLNKYSWNKRKDYKDEVFEIQKFPEEFTEDLRKCLG